MNIEQYEQIINTAQDCVFWKDKERRFTGVNQAFLDFYGFASEEVLLGKTDEDMGWHSDPEPFKQDELRVLAGESTYKVAGKCKIRGEERDIIASKRPLYDGDEIIGLVGSFVDVTEVLRRQKLRHNSQVLYSVEQLRRYPFFDKLLDTASPDELLDSLTGVLSRAYIIAFVKDLIANGTPFSFAMVDLDNFKFINDNYGHHAGDGVLMDVARSLAVHTDGFGLVGRFGGDELLIIDLKDLSYDDKKEFLSGLYYDQRILRKNILLEDCNPYITATIGCASFPEDAQDYDTLFSMIDKTLYRGKNKGRNCYIIYVDSKHRDLEIKKIARHGVYTNMQALLNRFDHGTGITHRLRSVMQLLTDELQISDLYYVDAQGILQSVLREEIREEVPDLGRLMNTDLYTDNTMEGIRKTSPDFYRVLRKYSFETVLIVRVALEDLQYGYLLCAEPRTLRLWQESECALMLFLARILAAHIRIDELTAKLPES